MKTRKSADYQTTKLWFAVWLSIATSVRSLFGATESSPDRSIRSAIDSYSFYEPSIEQHYIYQDLPDSSYAFGHMVSIEYFDGKFHAVWNNSHGGHGKKFFAEKNTPQPFQRLLWQTSVDAKDWSKPIRITESATSTPLDRWSDAHTHWQPNLLNYRDQELWCLWSIGDGAYFPLPKGVAPSTDEAKSLAGTYLSTLGKGPKAEWKHRKILGRVELPAPGSRHPRAWGYLFPSQNPVLLPNGRVIQPVTYVLGDRLNMGSLESEGYFNAAIYSDDGGRTWQISNLVSNVDNPLGQWEPHVMPQADGRLRMFIRDSGRRGIHAPLGLQYRNTIQQPLFLTTTGTGTELGQPIVFEPDVKRVWLETEGSRMYQLLLPDGRHCMLHHDVWNGSNFGTRSNLALFFSRTGEDDFVAGPGIAGRSNPAHYAQGVVHDGKLYVAYTRWNPTSRLDGSTSDAGGRGIAISVIDPLPDPKRRYVWPRDKDYYASGTPEWRKDSTEATYVRPSMAQADGRACLEFRERGSAGVEIDRVDFSRGESLEVTFKVKVIRQQTFGSLVLCSFGDRIPIRIGLPGNRPGMLYAYGRHDWEQITPFSLGSWHTMTVRFGADEFSIAVDGGKPVTCTNPMRQPTPRLYLGDGYEMEIFESNRDSEFLIELASLRTNVRSKQ